MIIKYILKQASNYYRKVIEVLTLEELFFTDVFLRQRSKGVSTMASGHYCAN